MVIEIEQTPQFPEALTLPVQARSIVISDQETYTAAATFKITLADMRRKIVDEFKPMKEAAHKAHKAITSKEAEYLAPVTEAEGILISSLKAWQAEQERLQRIETARLQELHRQEMERQRLAAEAEAKLIRDEELRVQAEARKRDDEERLAAAEAAQKAGDEVTADILIGRMNVHDKAAWMLRSTAKAG